MNSPHGGWEYITAAPQPLEAPPRPAAATVAPVPAVADTLAAKTLADLRALAKAAGVSTHQSKADLVSALAAAVGAGAVSLTPVAVLAPAAPSLTFAQ